MSYLWIICGAGRGVGKTTVAQGLKHILGQSVYAKCGHAAAKQGKPPLYFNRVSEVRAFIQEARESYDHIIIESNALALDGQGDIVVYIDGVTDMTHGREDCDKLKAAANIRICRGISSDRWIKTLKSVLGPSHLIQPICVCFLAQKSYLFGSGPKAYSKVWFEAAGSHIFGNGLAVLLDNIDRLGTLQDAAKASRMSYRYAWDLVKKAERHLGQSLIDKHPGGRQGGRSDLSTYSRDLLDCFNQLNRDVAHYADQRFAELARHLSFRLDR